MKRTMGVTGTLRYCSTNANDRYEQSRRDDLESLANILCYFANDGNLPWMRDIDDGQGESKEESDILQIKR